MEKNTFEHTRDWIRLQFENRLLNGGIYHLQRRIGLLNVFTNSRIELKYKNPTQVTLQKIADWRRTRVSIYQLVVLKPCSLESQTLRGATSRRHIERSGTYSRQQWNGTKCTGHGNVTTNTSINTKRQAEVRDNDSNNNNATRHERF